MKKSRTAGFVDFGEHLAAVALIREELRQCENGNRTRLLDEGVESIPENVLHARSKGIDPELFENADDVRYDQAALPFAATVEQVERKSAGRVLGIEIDNVIRPLARDMVLQNILDQLAMRIDDGDAMAGKDILGEHVPHERALTRTARSEERKMASPRGRNNVHRRTKAVGIFTAADENGIERHGKGF
jgi:hypothetical protein